MNPDGFEADFFLAMLFSVRGNFNPNIAESILSECLIELATLFLCSNNLALTEVKLSNFEQAHRYWRRAAAIDPRNVAIRHNLARVIREADRNLLPVPKQKALGRRGKNSLRSICRIRSTRSRRRRWRCRFCVRTPDGSIFPWPSASPRWDNPTNALV